MMADVPSTQPITSELPGITNRRFVRALAGVLPLLILPLMAVALAVVLHWPRWGIMWSLATAIFADCKWLTWWQRTRAATPQWRQVLFFFAWPGMDTHAFFDTHRHPPRPNTSEWMTATAKLALGFAILYGWARYLPPANPYWQGWLGMIGIILCLHFGTFHLLSCALRRYGIEARPLMNRPLASVRIAEFWGLRWNTAFRDLTHRFLFKPLTRWFGGVGAVWIGFLVSGVIHDAVISLPAGGGYGGPTLFFLLQPLGMFAERSRTGRRLGLGRGVRGWLFTMAFLLLPARLLFHKPFVVGIVVPFMRAIGALQ